MDFFFLKKFLKVSLKKFLKKCLEGFQKASQDEVLKESLKNFHYWDEFLIDSLVVDPISQRFFMYYS